ncbi:MFS transporter [Solimonas terrae]|uniref:MFS transporter n=1 Tax=Solimonas terrae TaxID=1396819 RepID=A0A6M2BMN5_9GAMM|nr:MFS transporter [Solimonas terrae]NGY03664.1 MFS transporter [Solimonas terrae]
METPLKNPLEAPLSPPIVNAGERASRTGFGVLGAISFAHFLNDMIQSLILAIYPLLKASFALSFAQIGLITLTYQFSASLLQPLIGLYTDRRPQPSSLAVGMSFTLCGLLLLAFAPSFAVVLMAAALVGTGSSIFHPESSRVARMASGGQHGLAQSLFQVGGNAGSAVGPLLAALIVLPHGQRSLAWFSLAALIAIGVLWKIGIWYRRQHRAAAARPKAVPVSKLPRRTVLRAMLVLMLLVFSKYFYLASITSYYTFYLMHRFGLSAQSAQLYLFAFLFAVAAGTVLGGPIGDRVGRKQVIWVSILGVAPFTLLLPHVGLAATGVLSVIIGFVLASAFSAILVFAQELAPDKVGAVSGLFFGFAFGMGGIAAAVLGKFADLYGIEAVYRACAFFPLLGVLTVLLPDQRGGRLRAQD